MSSKGLQLFAGGIFLATATLSGVFFLTPKPVDKEEPHRHPPSVVEMKEALEHEGYVVLTAAEMEERKSPDSDEQAKVIYKMVLHIKPGMTSYDIAEQLKRGRIIEDESAFIRYVQEKQAATSLRTGEYDVSSEQSIADILTTILKK